MNTARDWFQQQSHLTAIIALPTQTFLSLRDWFRQQSHLTAITDIPTQTFLSLRDWFRQWSHLTAITAVLYQLKHFFKGLVPATEPPHCHHCYTNSNISFFNPLCPRLPTLFPLFITDFLICIPGSLHMGFHSKRAAAGLGPSGLRAWFWQQSHLTAIIATPSSNISFFPFVNPFNPPHTRTHILCRQCPWAE